MSSLRVSVAWAMSSPIIARHAKSQSQFVRRAHVKTMACAASSVRNSDANAVAVVVGASRGIGLAITQKLIKRWKGRIVATCRDPGEAGALSALWQFVPHRFSIVRLDVEDESSVS